MKRSLSGALILIMLSGSAHAQFTQETADEFSRTGTSSAQFLKFAADARSAALGGAHSGLYGDVSSLYWNPAGIAAIRNVAGTATMLDLYANINYNFIGVVAPFSNSTTVGFSAIYLSSGEMIETTVFQPKGTGRTFEANSYAIGASFARYMTDNLMFGVTAKIVHEGIWLTSARTWAVDIGTVLETGLLGMKLGMALTNLGPDMTMRGDNLELEWTTPSDNFAIDLTPESWPLPVAFRVGVAMDLVGPAGTLSISNDNRLTAVADFNDAADTFTRANFGLEYVWTERIALRSGYYYNYDEVQLSYGGGIVWEMASYDLKIDYAAVDYGRLDMVNQFSLSIIF